MQTTPAYTAAMETVGRWMIENIYLSEVLSSRASTSCASICIAKDKAV